MFVLQRAEIDNRLFQRLRGLVQLMRGALDGSGCVLHVGPVLRLLAAILAAPCD